MNNTNKISVFIDGSAGTTGLRIYERLSAREDLELIILSDENRKDPAARKEAIHAADAVFLCLPDAAAIEAVALAEGSDTVIIDTSTAHRTAADWAYGFPELKGFRDVIRNSKRIANPGCHASGFIALVKPLIDEGLISADTALTCFSLTGYSGGGKKMIAEYEAPERDGLLKGPRQYGLTQQHKHLKEMSYVCGLNTAPIFSPIVADYYAGMEVSVPLFAKDLKGNIENLKETYQRYYPGPLVHFDEKADESGFLSAAAFAGRDDMQIMVDGNEERILLTARFDNLGKGASGAAIQNLNIKFGLDETAGLSIK
ncbi:MAG: N-acetyl-gamma-glutamyl-phosphate reductase [Anaerolineaceae bacterium]|nr:N-acetyl-gamma-glutamyl-phosphate reductase [Anaerolineaceae bacterium]